jgi:hypothetical protein
VKQLSVLYDLNEDAPDGTKIRSARMAPHFEVIRRYPGWVVQETTGLFPDHQGVIHAGGFHPTFQRAIAYAEWASGNRQEMLEWIRAYDTLPAARRQLIEAENELIRSQQLGDSASNFQALDQRIIDLHVEIERLEELIRQEPIDPNPEVTIE